MRSPDSSGCGVREIALEDLALEDLGFFTGEGSGAEVAPMDDFHLVVVFDVEDFYVECLSLCTLVADVEGAV